MKVLLFGSTGWIGGMMKQLYIDSGWDVFCATSRLEEFGKVQEEIDDIRPDRVVNAAGLTGRPNVDWCESNKQEVVRVNAIGTLALADACFKRGVHMTQFATGCIYEYDDEHPIGGPGFTEEDPPNFDGSWYSKTKIHIEGLLMGYPNVLCLRLRMPIDDDLKNPRNFITKISKYAKVVNVPNSMSYLPELLPKAFKMSKTKVTGLINFVNPGVISHNEILDLYSKYIDKTFTYENFTIEEQDKILEARRSNNCLDTGKFTSVCGEIRTITKALETMLLWNPC
jgi:dTDP-4-dehydrorhamnose reductase